MASKRNKALDNKLVQEVLKLEGGKNSINAADAHEFVKHLQTVLATDIVENLDNPRLFTNFLVGIENVKVKVRKSKGD